MLGRRLRRDSILIAQVIRMPLKSKAQWRYLWASHPEIAKKWIEEFPNVKYSKLPNKVGGILSPKVKKRRAEATSGDELLRYLDKPCRVLEYPELANFDSIEELLDPYGCAIILYLTDESYGHWCAIFRYPNSNKIEFFDSYGYFPDDEFSFVDDRFRKTVRGYEPHLTSLLYNYKGPMEYNDYRFQSRDDDTATCGLWVALRLLLRDLPLKTFKKLFLDLPRSYRIEPDDLVAKIFSEGT